jgi:uncharacterized protein (DUF1778 family)
MIAPDYGTYASLPYDARLEVRLPALLKAHLELMAEEYHQKVSTFVVRALAQAVVDELLLTRTFRLTPDEQIEALRVLSSDRNWTPMLNTAREQALYLFGAEMNQLIGGNHP